MGGPVPAAASASVLYHPDFNAPTANSLLLESRFWSASSFCICNKTIVDSLISLPLSPWSNLLIFLGRCES